ncbi:hypothetical protein BDV12DRAFT_199051 [Aspergillus spectabilis]
MADTSTARQTTPSDKRPRATRAPIACEYCHQRKTRCDLTYGVPCTNCRLDRIDCIKRAPRKPGSYRGGARSRNKNYEDPVHFALGLIPSNETLSNSNAQKDSAGPSVLNNISTANMNRLPFIFYTFLDASSIRRLQENEVAFLESQGCLHLPSRPVVETLLSHYFLYVHPCLPLVDEGGIWRMYREPDQHKGQLSLLLFQAMLFSAVPFIPEYVAKECGFASLVTARDDFYRKANLLYSHIPGNDHVVVAQTAVLLSYYNSNADAMCNSTWLSVAIVHAKAENAHQYDDLVLLTEKNRVMLKRLWWCCILRDRIISLGMRRPLQIRDDQFMITGACIWLSDLQDEVNSSEVYPAEMKLALSWVLIQLCHFAGAVTESLSIMYPASTEPAWIGDHKKEAHWESLQRARSSLSAWEVDFVPVMGHAAPQGQPSIILFVKLTLVYYQAARIALCNHACELAAQFEWPQTKSSLNYYKSELQDAVNTMTDQLKQLIAANLAKYLPVSTYDSASIALSDSFPILHESSRPLCVGVLMIVLLGWHIPCSR